MNSCKSPGKNIGLQVYSLRDSIRNNVPETIKKVAEMGYTFVYAILQDEWDATSIVTSKDGPYKGKTMYEITKELLNKQVSGL
jgi:hypothetical protein